jgi:hypothetical protein
MDARRHRPVPGCRLGEERRGYVICGICSARAEPYARGFLGLDGGILWYRIFMVVFLVVCFVGFF